MLQLSSLLLHSSFVYHRSKLICLSLLQVNRPLGPLGLSPKKVVEDIQKQLLIKRSQNPTLSHQERKKGRTVVACPASHHRGDVLLLRITDTFRPAFPFFG